MSSSQTSNIPKTVMYFPAEGEPKILKTAEPWVLASDLLGTNAIDPILLQYGECSVAAPWLLDTFRQEEIDEEYEEEYRESRKDIANWSEHVFALTDEEGLPKRLPINSHFQRHPTMSGHRIVGGVLVYRSVEECMCGDSALLDVSVATMNGFFGN
jgi:hypothetical protein